MLLLTAVFAVVEICYYAVGDGKFILAYHEMFQMFMWGWDYLASHLLYPGGLAEYVGEMITQFNYMPSLGASLLVMLLVACQGLMWLLIGRSENRCMYPLSFVPALAFCYLFTDENAMLSSLVATDVVMACMVWYERIAKTNKSNGKGNMIAAVFAAFATPVLYWLIPMSVDSYKTSVLKYDYLLRLQKWEEIVSDAEKVTPNMPITVSILNLALAEKNVLGTGASMLISLSGN